MNNSNYEKIPSLIYGTAWKEDKTEQLTTKAVLSGFRAIDTANQKKHYREDYVGRALLELKKNGIPREELFLQTKFTYVHGQDHRLPYNPTDDFSTQVRSSFASSLQNLHTDYIDSFLLHGPASQRALIEADWEVWKAIEGLYESGQTRMIGVSNVGVHHLEELTEKAKIKPMMVQNRCFANRGWDRSVRKFCQENQIIYQGFSLLTGNPQVLENPNLKLIADRIKVKPTQVLFRFATQMGILPLTGTSNEEHMKEDLQIFNFELSESDLALINSIS